MFMRYYCINRLVFVLLLIFVFVYEYNHRNIDGLKMNKTEVYSIFKERFNQRLFRLGQRFSHINIDLLFSIQISSNKTMTYYCENNCGGWGDRLRGITSTYILSILLERHFIIDMKYPCQLTEFIIPNLINWIPKNNFNKQNNYLKLNSINSKYQAELYSNISSINLIKFWSSYDNIILTTNKDYITPVLKNPFFKTIISKINIQLNESTQQDLFPFIFEILFKPTLIISQQLDSLLQKISFSSNHSIICMHIRIGQNPSIPKDIKLPYRLSLIQDMIEFIDRNLSYLHSSIFVTSDSIKGLEYIQKYYGLNRILNINGPIIHIDRYNSKIQSNELIYQGFLKVIADFYFLGECNIILMPRSGFSDWANRRRINQYSNLYIYCRGLHRVTSQRWRRPYTIC